MNDRTKVKVCESDNFFIFRTYSRKEKRSSTFYMTRATLEELFSKGRAVAIDSVSFATLWYDKEADIVGIRFRWLRLHSDNALTGREEFVRLPAAALHAFVWQSAAEDGPKDWKVLSVPELRTPHLVFRSTRNLKAVTGNKALYRKFLKVLRKEFEQKHADEVVFYDDSQPYSFFFQEMHGGERGICGGVILHNYENDLTTAKYGVHT